MILTSDVFSLSSTREVEPDARSCLAGGGEMGALMRAFDWSKTPLGSVESWSPALRMMTEVLLANRFPMLLWWGADFLQLYNDAYSPVLGDKHPHMALGRPFKECWAEVFHLLGPLAQSPYNGGPATWVEDILCEVNRYGFMEETHFTIAYSPVPDETAPRGIGGVLAMAHEITDKVVGERRLAALRDLATRATEAKTAKEACTVAANTLANHAKDVPFALLYLMDEKATSAHLAGVAGVEDCKPLCPEQIDLHDIHAQWPLAVCREQEKTILSENLQCQFERVPSGPWRDPPHCAAVVPIMSNLAHHLAGFLIAGISSRLRFDDAYRGFLELASAQIGTAIANARAYEEEKKRAEALAEIDRAKTAFFSNVSHEFRTPLTLMLGPIEDALSDPTPFPVRVREQLEVAHRNSLRLLKLVNSLLDFSRIEAGRVKAVFEPIDLSTLTAELASNFRSVVERAGLFLSVDCPPLPDSVYVDPEMWEKIVLNLLSNAFKFTFDGGIVVKLQRDGNQVELSVADTGTGIPGSELPHMFERFHRVRYARGRTHEGTGIGLALVQELVRLHGGNITVESILGQGTTFRVRLQCGKAHLPPGQIGRARDLVSTAISAESFVQEALHWRSDEHIGQPAEAMRSESAVSDVVVPRQTDLRRERVLIVDDNADMRDYLRRLLAPAYEFRSAPNGEAALGAIQSEIPDLILCDIMMPTMDGFTLLKRLRSYAATRSIPIIFLSARAGEEASIEGMDAGADDYLIKPFSARELLARVGAHLRLIRRRREADAIFRTTLASLTDAVIASDPEGRVQYVNPAAEELTGWPQLEAFGEAIEKVYSVKTMRGEDVLECQLRRALARAQPIRGGRFVLLSRSGREIPVQDAAAPILHEGRMLGAVSIFNDITVQLSFERQQAIERDRLEADMQLTSEALGNSRAELQALASHLMTAQEDERRRVARELHDDFGQRAAVLEFALESLRRGLDASHETLDQLESIRSQIRQLSEELRNASHRLHPSMLQNLGLTEAVRVLIEEHRKRGEEISFVEHGLSVDLPATVTSALYRILQESLRNAAKHAPTAPVHVSLLSQGSEFELKVEDAGPGFELKSVRGKGGLGLLGMQERARSVGGSITIEPIPGEGTTISVRVRTSPSA